VNQYKTSEDLEIYEMDYANNGQLQEICNVKQPIIFEFHSLYPEFFEDVNIENMGNHDVKVKDSNDYEKEIDSVDYITLPFQSSQKLMKTDSNGHFFIENNNEFVEESAFYKLFRNMDTYFKPSFTLQTKYDICMGSKNAVTPLRYNTNYRNFYVVTSGKVHIKMTPYKSKKYLYPIKDYENYEFRSPINVWNPQKKYLNEMDKLKFLEFDVNAGYVIYIPPYWWYSIKYSKEEDTVMCGFTYNSIMNIIANIPDWILYFIQQQNTKKKIVKTLDLDIIQNENKVENV
jgi:hypothetical protein